MKKVLLIVGIVVVVAGLGGFLFWQDLKSGALEESGDLAAIGQEFPNEGQTHIPVGSEHAPYGTNPPTSGPHYEQPAAWGVYANPLPDEQVVHNLEHGGIWISYKGVDADTKAKLEDIGEKNSNSVVVSPREANDAPIALASWTRYIKLDTFDRAKIEEFIKHNINKSPEPLAR